MAAPRVRGGGLSVLVALTAANGLGYLLTVVASRRLGPEGYGALAALLGLVLVGNVLALGLQAVVARRVVAGGVADAARWAPRVTAAGAAALGVVALLVSPAVVDLLHLGSAWPAVAAGRDPRPADRARRAAGAASGRRADARPGRALRRRRCRQGRRRRRRGPRRGQRHGDHGRDRARRGRGAVVWGRAGPTGAAGRRVGSTAAGRVLAETARATYSLGALFALTNVDVVLARSALPPGRPGSTPWAPSWPRRRSGSRRSCRSSRCRARRPRTAAADRRTGARGRGRLRPRGHGGLRRGGVLGGPGRGRVGVRRARRHRCGSSPRSALSSRSPRCCSTRGSPPRTAGSPPRCGCCSSSRSRWSPSGGTGRRPRSCSSRWPPPTVLVGPRRARRGRGAPPPGQPVADADARRRPGHRGRARPGAGAAPPPVGQERPRRRRARWPPATCSSRTWPRPTALAFVAFCAASSSVYLLNDVVDVVATGSHPEKRRRPVASGAVAPWQALSLAAVLAVVALAVATAAGRPALAVTIATYLALSTAYNLGLKHQRVVDLPSSPSGSCCGPSRAAPRPACRSRAGSSSSRRSARCSSSPASATPSW